MFVLEVSTPVCHRAHASRVPSFRWQASGGQAGHSSPRPPLPTSIISCTPMEKNNNKTVSLAFMTLLQNSIDSCETRWGVFLCSSCHMGKQMTESHHLLSPAVVCTERVQPCNLQSCPSFAVTSAWMIFFSLLSCQLLRLSCLRLRQGHFYVSQRRLAPEGGVHTSFCREKENGSILACVVSCRPFKAPR